MAPKRKKEEGLLSRLPSNPYAKFRKPGSREEKMREIWGMAHLDQYWRARAIALQAGLPDPNNLLPTGKRANSDKAKKIKEEWLVEEVKRQSLLEEPWRRQRSGLALAASGKIG